MTSNRPKKQGLVVDLRVGESLALDLVVDATVLLRPCLDMRKIRLTLESKHGQIARVRVQADESVKVGRPEPAPT